MTIRIPGPTHVEARESGHGGSMLSGARTPQAGAVAGFVVRPVEVGLQVIGKTGRAALTRLLRSPFSIAPAHRSERGGAVAHARRRLPNVRVLAC
jgi:hypothetical protein